MIPTLEAEAALTGRPDQLNEKKSDLTESELTSATASLSEDDANGSWFGDIKSLAQSTRNAIIPAVNGIASIIQRSAMTVATEIAQLERDAELEAERWGDASRAGAFERSEELPLPWERHDTNQSNPGGKVMTTQDMEGLKQKIFELAKDEKTFLEPFNSAAIGDRDFLLSQPQIRLIRRLLELDENLGKLHSRLSGRSDVEEAIFWKNYFFHCAECRQNHVSDLEEGDDTRSRSTLGSLVPAESVASIAEDDKSYVCIRSPPSSLNTVTGTVSIGDMVLVGEESLDVDDENE